MLQGEYVPARREIRVLIVDDDRVTRELLRAILERENYTVTLASSGEEALTVLDQNSFPIILSDIHMFDLGGLELLTEMKRRDNDAIVILMTGYGSLESAIEAIHQGAFDYLSKPIRAEELKALLERAVRHIARQRAVRTRELPAPVALVPKTLIGRSQQIVQVYKTLAKATMISSNVLILGESGTGKELVARAIHENSARKKEAFVTVNCGALTESLLESELFGHVKGSFTGAIATKRGLFDEANAGTIFLDEIGDITAALQVKLLRVIQEGEFKPVGSNEIRKVDCRIIAATHRDLEALVRQNRFREDLYYRLKVILIQLPPLRERMQDLSELVGHFLKKFSDKTRKHISEVSEDAWQLLKNYSWPGNIRELEHAMERAVAMTNGSTIYSEDLPPEIESYCAPAIAELRAVPQSEPFSSKSLEQMEKAHIVRILNEVNFNKSKAADILGIDRATLYRKAQRYGIRLAEEKERLS